MKSLMNNLSTKYKIPFNGLNDDAVQWLRTYINPSDIGRIIPTGIPDKEVAPSATFAKTITYAYNADTFKSFLYTSDESNNPQVKVERETYNSTTFILYPNMHNALLVIENGSYNVQENTTKGGTFTSLGVCSHVAAWFFDPMMLDGVPSSATTVNYNNTYYGSNSIIATRMMGASLTIYNSSNIMNQGGQFICKSFPIQTYGKYSTDEMYGESYFGSVPIDSKDFASQGAAYDYKTLKGPEGVYTVAYNWHPEFKYQMPVVNWMSPAKAATNGVFKYFTVYQGVIPDADEMISGLKRVRFDVPDYTSLKTNFNTDNGVLLQPEWNNGVGAGVKPIPFMAYTNDDWTWKGMAVNYTVSDLSNLSLNVKVCLAASQMLGPLSKLNTMSNPPPYTSEILTFAALFTREQDHSYPASWNDWNKIWEHIKTFYRSNKDWLKATGRYALAQKGITGIL